VFATGIWHEWFGGKALWGERSEKGADIDAEMFGFTQESLGERKVQGGGFLDR